MTHVTPCQRRIGAYHVYGLSYEFIVSLVPGDIRAVVRRNCGGAILRYTTSEMGLIHELERYGMYHGPETPDMELPF